MEIFSRHKLERVLDVGCGDGGFSLLLRKASECAGIYGIDASASAVSQAVRRGVGAIRVDLDTDSIPFDNDSFDGVFAGEVIEHVFDPDHLLDEIFRVLKPGGVFVLTTPNLASLQNRIALLLGYEPFSLNPSLRYAVGHLFEVDGVAGQVPSGDHIRVMTLRSLMRLLRLHRFSISEVRGSSALAPNSASSLHFTLANRVRSRLVASTAWKFAQVAEAALSKLPSLSFRVIVTGTKIASSNSR